MPLFKGKSRKAFSHNVATEMDEGKPQKQALAIAYSLARRGKKKMASGGMLTDSGYQSECDEHCNDPCEVHMSDREGYALGGETGYEKGVHKTEVNTHSGMGSAVRPHGVVRKALGEKEAGEYAKHEARRVLDEMKSQPNPKLMSEGGMLTDEGYQDDSDELDMVGRIMARRMSEGGKVANTDEPTADFMPNEFDDLHLRDDLEQNYTAANSGDELSDDQEDADRHDIVSRIMASRRKRPGMNPRVLTRQVKTG